MRRAAKRDANERGIIEALEARGHLVAQVNDGGIPDLIVWSRIGRRLVLIEVKDGNKPPSARGLTPKQYDWHTRWMDAADVIHIVTDAEQALHVVDEA